MINYSVKELCAVIKGKITGNEKLSFQTVSIDSRTIIRNDKVAFFAIRGNNKDGHDYIQSLVKEGVKVFVVNNLTFQPEKYPGTCFTFVEDTLKALQAFAAHHRSRFDYPVLAITGSNGKTIIKEWLYQAMQFDKKIIRSPKSYNSQVGVPLSVLLMDEDYDLGFFEAGISLPGEMQNIAEIISPTIGIFSNIGDAHQENFNSVEQKIEEKLLLFESVDKIFYCKDYEAIDKALNQHFPNKRLICWSVKSAADLSIKSIITDNDSSKVSGEYKNQAFTISIPFIDHASVENCLHIVLIMLDFGYEPEEISSRLSKLQPIAMRLEMKQGINHCSIINDSYNSDFNSLIIALDFLNRQDQNPVKTLILSDILESSKDEEELYKSVAALIVNKNIHRFIGIGKAIGRHRQIFKGNYEFYNSTDEFLQTCDKNKFNNEAILIKGARQFEFEKISAFLEYKGHRTILEIDMNAMVHNLNYFRSHLKPETKLMAMVKAFSYGSGTYEIASLMQYHRVDYLGVAFADEGVELRKNGITMPVMVMQAEERIYQAIIDYNLEPEIYSFEGLISFEKLASSLQIKNFPVHIKVDTGMHRLGFMPDETGKIIQFLKNTESLKVLSVLSHLAASDEPEHDTFTRQQINHFKDILSEFSTAFDYPIIYHILNSEGILRFPEAQFGMVRLGIGLYGVSANFSDKLANVSTLKSTIIQVKNISKGETVGYGRKWNVKKNMKLGIIPIGYADGINRRLGNGRGRFLIGGRLVPVVGNICMDVCMVDLSETIAKPGDEVIIFGKENRVEEMARVLETIPYEIFTGISERVKRVYFQE